ncbi:MAG: S8 family serine peptidase, partial [Rhodothermales bacterium]|nr:S8 family serine peptidase [Rhodothermales bacterium]
KRIEGSGGADTRHGAAVVRALAEYLPPNATLHLVNFDTEPEFHRALDNVVHQLDVDVITCSVSWANAYDHYDGTSYFSRRVEQILSTDTPLVVAAGNFAQSHWQSDYDDSNTNGIHNFDPSAELLELKLNNARYYNFLMSWNDWGGDPRVDLDIEIYNAAGELLLDRRGRPYASRSVQGPSEYAEPLERIRGFKPIYPGTRPYYVKVFRKRGTPDPVERGTNFELYVSPPPEDALPGPVVRSSLAAGIATTDSPAVIPIGANDLSHSSQGPTNDGRIRPDFSADGVVELDGARIRGTSFATPRVAAALGLVFSRHPDWGINEAYDFLRRFAVQPDGSAGKNERFGWGQLDLDALIEALTS